MVSIEVDRGPMHAKWRFEVHTLADVDRELLDTRQRLLQAYSEATTDSVNRIGWLLELQDKLLDERLAMRTRMVKTKVRAKTNRLAPLRGEEDV